MQCWHYSISPFLFLIRCKGMIRKSRYFHVPSRSVKNHTQMLQVIIRIASYTVATRTLNGILAISFFLQGTNAKEMNRLWWKIEETFIKKLSFSLSNDRKMQRFLNGGNPVQSEVVEWKMADWNLTLLISCSLYASSQTPSYNSVKFEALFYKWQNDCEKNSLIYK